MQGTFTNWIYKIKFLEETRKFTKNRNRMCNNRKWQKSAWLLRIKVILCKTGMKPASVEHYHRGQDTACPSSKAWSPGTLDFHHQESLARTDLILTLTTFYTFYSNHSLSASRSRGIMAFSFLSLATRTKNSKVIPHLPDSNSHHFVHSLFWLLLIFWSFPCEYSLQILVYLKHDYTLAT